MRTSKENGERMKEHYVSYIENALGSLEGALCDQQLKNTIKERETRAGESAGAAGWLQTTSRVWLQITRREQAQKREGSPGSSRAIYERRLATRGRKDRLRGTHMSTSR